MVKPIVFLIALLSLSFSPAYSHSSPSAADPLPLLSLRAKPNQTLASTCTFRVQITTSCNSVQYTRDQISLSFGDRYGNQVYVPRIDNPAARAFDACSTDTFDISGPCTYDVCYVYLYRRGPDGWKVGSVRISSPYIRAVSFNYNDWIPANTWWGYNYCNGSSSKGIKKSQLSTLIVIILALLCFLLDWSLL